MRSVAFIHRGGEEMASFRYRAKVPAEHIGASINKGAADIIVFSKPSPDDVAIAKSAKEHGAKIVVDVCDPHFNLEHYVTLVKMADLCTCPTEVTREIVGKYSKNVWIIPDPYEMPEVAPHADGDKALWFGHNVNFDDIKMYGWVPNLRIVSGPKVWEGITHWSPENIDRAMREANICLFPTRQGAEYKSPNRFLNAVRMGMFPICNLHPSYEEFKGKAWIGDIHTGYKWAMHFKKDLNSLVRDLQDQIRDKYSPEKVGERWKSVLESV